MMHNSGGAPDRPVQACIIQGYDTLGSQHPQGVRIHKVMHAIHSLLSSNIHVMTSSSCTAVFYPTGLQAKESRMRDLVSLAEKREAACKDEISNLLASRSTMYESRPSSSQTSKAAAAAAAAPAPAAADAAEGEEQEQPEMQDEDNEETAEAAAAKIEEAERRMEAAQVRGTGLDYIILYLAALLSQRQVLWGLCCRNRDFAQHLEK